jgi:hypothetical protein
MKLNDILVSSGGYECTMVTFFKVIKVQNGFVTVKVLKDKVHSFINEPGTLGSGQVVPTDEFKVDTPIRKKIKYYNGEPYIPVGYSTSAYIWDGTPQQFDFRNR